MRDIKASDLRKMSGKEGLILQGCGGDPQEWIDGINELLTDEEILLEDTRFQNVSRFQHDGVTKLLFPFEDVNLDVGKLAMWRLKTHEMFGGRSACAVSVRLRRTEPSPKITQNRGNIVSLTHTERNEVERTARIDTGGTPDDGSEDIDDSEGEVMTI